MHALKISQNGAKTASHQYKKVPLDPESDSEDDEAILYAAPSLNSHADSSRKKDRFNFGVGIYDHGRDLELPRVRRMPSKKEMDLQRRYTSMRHCFKLFLLLVFVVVAVVAVSLFLVAVNTGYFAPPMSSSPSTPAPTCSPVPKPLANSEIRPCGDEETTTSTEHTSEPTAGETERPSEPTNAPFDGTEEPSETTPTHATPHITPSEPEIADTKDADPDQGINKPPLPNDVIPVATPTFPEASCFPVPKPLDGQLILPCPTPAGDAATTPPPPREPVDLSYTTQSTKVEDQSTAGVTEPAVVSAKTDTFSPDASTQKTTITADSATQDGTNSATDEATKATPLFWEREFLRTMSETTPQLHDVNGDGIEDVLVAVDLSQCSSKVVALDAKDGSIVWQQSLQFAAFAVRCVLDVDSDGTHDCLVSGRSGGFVALNSVDGAILWAVDQSIVFPVYNFYFPLVVDDMDDDGVRDIVNVHGGDPKYGPEQHDRSPAFLVAVSGRTGETLMEPVPMPDGHESYSSPMLFAVSPSDQFVLFGSGGETVPGSLWAVELDSLRMRVALHHAHSVTAEVEYFVNMHTLDVCLTDPDTFERVRPVFDGAQYSLNRTMATTPSGHLKCPPLANKQALWNEYNVCLYEIVRGVGKGVMLPPVIVDMTLDGVQDLVVSTYDGRTMVLDGQNLSRVVWEAYFPDTESYSLPSPLFYTSDDIPDLVIRTNMGSWPDYSISTIRVLDGADGSQLWSFNSSHDGLMSAISVLSNTHGRDAMVFVAIGILDGHGEQATRQRERREAEPTAREWAESMSREWAESAGGHSSVDDADEVERVLRHAQMNHDIEEPPDLWVSTPDDPVPDPNDAAALFEYCGRDFGSDTTYVYMVNREMIESGMDITPLASYEPYVFLSSSTSNTTRNSAQSPTPHSMSKRHGDADTEKNHTHSEDEDHAHSEDEPPKMIKMSMRCSHITTPTGIYTTPLLTDLDLDGQLDIVYVIVWSSGYKPESFKTLVVGSNLEKLFEKGYGTEILNFDTFLPPSEQPWSQYMGHRGDSNFTLKNR